MKANPEESRAIYLLSQLAIKGHAYQVAMSFLKQHLTLVGETKEVLLQLAQVQSELGMLDEAAHNFSKLIRLYPDWSVGLFSMAGFLQSTGELQKAESLLNKVIQLDPEHCGAYLALSGLIKLDRPNSLTDAMEQLELKLTKENKKHQQMLINYALGKAYDDLRLYDKAFSCWQKANKIQLANCQFRVAQMRPFFGQLISSFRLVKGETSNHPEDLELNKRLDQITPIFIVGLPRTGSTLLEQMLTQHSDIATVGESNAVASVLAAGIQKVTKQTFPSGLESLTSKQWQLLGKSYLKHLQQTCPKHSLVINKLPANFQSIGIIKKAIPQAVIIHLTRTPQAVALSVFKNYFSANEPYFCDLQEFSLYRKLYLKVMAFWHSCFQDSIFELTYERLIADPEKELRQILEICGLNWQSRCLDFNSSDSQVKTLSDTQVKKPIYGSSVDAWRKYSQYLTVLEDG